MIFRNTLLLVYISRSKFWFVKYRNNQYQINRSSIFLCDKSRKIELKRSTNLTMIFLWAHLLSAIAFPNLSFLKVPHSPKRSHKIWHFKSRFYEIIKNISTSSKLWHKNFVEEIKSYHFMGIFFNHDVLLHR